MCSSDLVTDCTIVDEDITVDPGQEDGVDDFEPGENKPGTGEGGDTGEDTPSISGAYFYDSPFDIKEPIILPIADVDFDNPAPLAVTIKAPKLFAHIEVIIDSETITNELLTDVGLTTEFDLAYPGQYEPALGAGTPDAPGFGFPVGDEVIGKSEVLFDITAFTPLLGIYGAANHNFIIKVTDQAGTVVTETLNIISR